ncbi:redoxin domain-containing protein [Haloarcula pelagica]|uniref:redoxin domain-containing protein n=1 Tax=Haloarcula pelagica TaxID=3033389 RepID=UPI0024C35369|nr:redoxin domain-containing protein [Halomicroarcula sp. YJ-61-S]
MVEVGDDAPRFTAPLANGDVDEVTLAGELNDGPVVLAFFPGAFTSVCSHEMSTFQDRIAEIEDTGATLFGVSIDTPFAQNAFRDELDLSFDLISDNDRDLISAYDVGMDFAELGVHDVAKRAVFVVDSDGIVSYAWVSDDPGVEPDYDAVVDAVQSA